MFFFTGGPSYHDVEQMAIYVCWEIDMLFCVKLSQNIIKRGSCCRWCVQMKITIATNVTFDVYGLVTTFPQRSTTLKCNTNRLKAGIVRAGVQVYFEQF